MTKGGETACAKALTQENLGDFKSPSAQCSWNSERDKWDGGREREGRGILEI